MLTLADFIALPAVAVFAQPTPDSSLTWMLELSCDRYDDLGLDDWRVDASLLGVSDGQTSQSVMLWGPRGEPVSLSWQSSSGIRLTAARRLRGSLAPRRRYSGGGRRDAVGCGCLTPIPSTAIRPMVSTISVSASGRSAADVQASATPWQK